MIRPDQREDLIEKYILGEMNADELRSFEMNMSADPELKEEVLLQSDIIKALQNNRKAEFKASLDKIEVGPAPVNSYLSAGIASVALISSLVLITLFWPEDSNPVAEQNPVQEEAVNPEKFNEVEEFVSDNLSDSKDETDFAHKNEITEAESNTEAESSFAAAEEVINEEPEEMIEESPIVNPAPKIQLPAEPEPVSPGDIGGSSIDESRNSQIKSSSRETSRVEVELKSDKDYNFHYQFHDGKLYLFGDFSKSPYELIELNLDDERNLYLYFEGKYYGLNTESFEITRLSPLRDKIIIKGLENLRDI